LLPLLIIRAGIIKLIEREVLHANKGKKAHIILKMNSLVDPTFISALYAASQRGVKIDLIIRGICCLVPQVPGLSENIRVISIVGRFLEHSRIFYFLNDGNEEVYCGSADLMQRNLDRRVEVIFPIESEEHRKTIINKVLIPSLKDNVKARVLLPTGKYSFNHPVYNEAIVSVQDYLMNLTTSDPVKTIQREKNKKK
jgi:polyphosphate kinase